MKKCILLLSLYFLSTVTFSQDGGTPDIKQLAFDYYLKNKKITSTAIVTIKEVKYLQKNAKLYMLRTPHSSNSSSRMFAVTLDKKVMDVDYQANLKVFANQLNPIIVKNEFVISSSIEAQKHLKNIFEIYGIYNSKMNCKTIDGNKKYKCNISETSPREFQGNIVVDYNGTFEVIKNL